MGTQFIIHSDQIYTIYRCNKTNSLFTPLETYEIKNVFKLSDYNYVL